MVLEALQSEKQICFCLACINTKGHRIAIDFSQLEHPYPSSSLLKDHFEIMTPF